MTAAAARVPDKRERRLAVQFFVTMLAFSTVFALDACHSNSLEVSAQATAKDLALPEVRGGTFHLRLQPARPVLLAFLQIRPDTMDTPSHREVAFLKSMQHQYSARGLRFAIVDATAMASGQRPAHRDLLNASYDWQLELPLLEDSASDAARIFTITRVPTIILLNAEGGIAQRWEGFTDPASLAQGIEKLVGGPLTRQP